MEYVASGAESMPFPDGTFDLVCSFNSLDHVDDLGLVIPEIVRVLAPGGLFLLITDIHRHATVLEPAAYSWEIVGQFQPELELVHRRHDEYTVFTSEGFGDILSKSEERHPV